MQFNVESFESLPLRESIKIRHLEHGYSSCAARLYLDDIRAPVRQEAKAQERTVNHA